MQPSITAFIGLGANLGRDPAENLRAAIEQLGGARGTRVVSQARFYRTPPLGPEGQPPYSNTAVEIETTQSPRELLALAKTIERNLGRVPSVRWGPRAIDVDILIYGTLVLREPDLIIPHAELACRGFVLAPLADLRPDLVVPGLNRTLRALLDSLPHAIDGFEILGMS